MDSINIGNENIYEKTNNDLKTFNKLLNIQKLVKKESTLKELFINTKKDCENKIETICTEIYLKKIEVLNILQKNESNTKKIKYNLIIDSKNYLNEIYLYIEKFMTSLWNNPLLIAKILMNSNIIDVKYYLAPLITNNFYENILSNNHVEDQLLYIISILLENEINELKDINSDIFLNNTPCSYILGELVEKKDVKDFFKIILKDLIKDMETINGKNVFMLDIEKIESFLIQKYKEKDDNKNNNFFYIDTINLDNNDKTKIMNEKFFKKYAIDLTIPELKAKNNNKNNNKIFNEYINSLTKDQNNESLYSNKNFIGQMNSTTFSKEILLLFEKIFFEIINFIEKILDNFLNNIELVPYSIRCICKMILFYTQKKFPNSTNLDIFSFFSKFLINNLFIPILTKPDTGTLISDYIISNNTLNNLKIISEIFLKFSSFKLYTENDIGNYTPFNIFFINNINKLIEFYIKLTEINFPNFLDELIKGNILKENYKYNYFKEHKDELFFHRTIFLTTYHVKVLVENINNIKENIFNENNDNDTQNLKKMFEKLNKIDKLDSLKDKVNENIFNDDKKENILNINYFIISNLSYDEDIEILFKKTVTKNYLQFKDNKNNNKDNIDPSSSNIKKVKNILCAILDNYDLLEKTDFIKNNITYDTMSILNKLKLFSKSFDFVMDNNIPTEWYIKLLFDFLYTLPEDYRVNDFQKLYDELENDITNSIKQYNFEELCILIRKIKYAKKNNIYYDDKKKTLLEINLNNKVINIIENENINISIYYKLNEKEQKLNIYRDEIADKQIQFLDKLIFKKDGGKPKLCRTIQSFIQNFPDLNKYIKINAKNCNDVLELEKKLQLPIKLKNFFIIILKILNSTKNIFGNEKELYLIYDKIYDYVMSMLYNSIFPAEEDIIDYQLYEKTKIFSWIEPKNLIENYQLYDLDLVLPDIINFFEGFDKEKSPRKKIINMNNIFTLTDKLIKFSTNNNILGVDDQMPLINYLFIKARPKKTFTNIKFMETYMGSKINGIEGSQLILLKTIGTYIIGIDSSKLYCISEEEFKQKCSKELSKIYEGEKVAEKNNDK